MSAWLYLLLGLACFGVLLALVEALARTEARDRSVA